jgi:hypothetical protein
MSIAVLNRPKQNSIGTLLLCYSETDCFIEGEEYEIVAETEEGYYILDNDGCNQLFKSMDDVKDVFMFE